MDAVSSFTHCFIKIQGITQCAQRCNARKVRVLLFEAETQTTCFPNAENGI